MNRPSMILSISSFNRMVSSLNRMAASSNYLINRLILPGAIALYSSLYLIPIIPVALFIDLVIILDSRLFLLSYLNISFQEWKIFPTARRVFFVISLSIIFLTEFKEKQCPVFDLYVFWLVAFPMFYLVLMYKSIHRKRGRLNYVKRLAIRSTITIIIITIFLILKGFDFRFLLNLILMLLTGKFRF